MQIPLWAFLLTILVALSWREIRMASFVKSAGFQLGRSVNANVPTALFGGATTGAGAGAGAGIRAILPSFALLNRQSTPSTPTSTTTASSLYHSTTHKHFSTTTASMSSKAFLETVKARRTYYALKKESTIPDAKVQEIIKETVLHVPSSFNSQSTRVVLLVKEEHDKLWEITKETLKAIVSAEQWTATEQRLNGFKAAYGTVSISYSYSYFLNLSFFLGLPLVVCHFWRGWWDRDCVWVGRSTFVSHCPTSHMPHLPSSLLLPNSPSKETQLTPSPLSGPLLRIPLRHLNHAREVRPLRRQIPSLGNPIRRHAPIHHLDRSRGRGSRCKPPALQPLDRPEGC